MANRLKEKYTNEVVPALTEKFNYSSVMAVPKVEKIVLNMGVGDAVSNAKNLEKAARLLGFLNACLEENRFDEPNLESWQLLGERLLKYE